MQGQNNLNHVLRYREDCGDPDCELHHPSAIEDKDQRLTAMAWQLAGACKLVAETGVPISYLETIQTVLHDPEAEA